MEELNFTVINFQDKFAILNNQKFNFQIQWPIKLLPDQIAIGDSINIGNSNSNSNSVDIKKLLEELIN
jgi:hypothetical protein